MRTHKINRWQDWKEIASYHDFDPYEQVDFGIDLGGGNSEDFEYLGDIPEREK